MVNPWHLMGLLRRASVGLAMTWRALHTQGLLKLKNHKDLEGLLTPIAFVVYLFGSSTR